MEFNGLIVSKRIKEQLKEKLKDEDITLAIITNKDDGSISYLKSRIKLCESLNIKMKVYYQEDIEDQASFIDLITLLNNDVNITGIMLDRPLLNHFNEKEIFEHLSYKKDVDGCTTYNAGLLMQNKNCLTSLTPSAVMLLLEEYQYDVSGKKVCVIGRSMNVGMPLFHLLVNKNATVTLCHSKTKDLSSITNDADLVIVAIGKKEFIDESYVNSKTTLIDVGIHYNEDGTLTGDVKKDVYQKVLNYSPVPKGVGPLTSVSLVYNLLKIKKGLI
ncbi:MAG: bifunctional 5,10-methylenetetrahydrofolate dehydrogenase/5,10-methenyltetrahydrofolate cyclohydrolase [Bacilli bacterium]|nr:bifunctional 5,10-methylenetetrahydrofolate dehydrogenase/5,10-methenyltetrahydrofolate cyclohydrolase [Bacilli bacterium]